MSRFNQRRRVALAALLATATIGSATPAQASTGAASADCDVRLEQIMAQFRDIEERRGYEAATEWWQKRWHAYYQSCGGN
jgi:hypothetical protein